MSAFLDHQIDSVQIQRARRSDPDAFAAIYVVFRNPVFGLALRLSNDRDVAAEWAQDVFVDVFTRIAGYRGDGSFAGWVRAIALNRCRVSLLESMVQLRLRERAALYI